MNTKYLPESYMRTSWGEIVKDNCWQSRLAMAKFWTESVDYGYDDISYIRTPSRFLALDACHPYIGIGNTNTHELIALLFDEIDRI